MKYKEIRHEEYFVPEAKNILQYNRKRLYKLPKKFSELQAALKPELMEFLLDTIAFWLKKDCIAFGKHPMVYFLGTFQGTFGVRKKQTKGVTNRYINYLCALGLLKKLPQIVVFKYEQGRERKVYGKNNLSKVSINVLKYDKNLEKRGLNTFEVIKYTSEHLEECNCRAKKLLEQNITPGNISYNQLAINGLEDIAKEVYLEERDGAVEKKEREYKLLLECIEFLIEQNGYATKEDIFVNWELKDTEIKKLFVIFKNSLWQRYTYKRPTAEQKQQFSLENDNWIITRK